MITIIIVKNTVLNTFFHPPKTSRQAERIPLKYWTPYVRHGSIKQSSSTCSADYYDIKNKAVYKYIS